MTCVVGLFFIAKRACAREEKVKICPNYIIENLLFLEIKHKMLKITVDMVVIATYNTLIDSELVRINREKRGK